MKRTTVMLPEDLKCDAEHVAHTSNRSLGQVIRDALKREVERQMNPSEDPLFKLETFDAEGPKDLSSHHDDYLYGGKNL